MSKKTQRKKIYRKTSHSLKLKNMKQLRKKKISKKLKGGVGCGSCSGNNNNTFSKSVANNLKNKVNRGIITTPEEVNNALRKRLGSRNNNIQQNNNQQNNNEEEIGDNNTNKYMVIHPLNKFISSKKDDKYILCINKDNVDKIQYDNIFHNAFFMKIVEILNYSFEREREYHISKGSYSPGYKHNIAAIKSNVNNPRFETLILVSNELEPISFLYVEKNEDDYDKIWTVCTNNEYRGKGMSSMLLNYMITRQLNKNRNKMLLEVYNDHIISREEEKDVVQKQIMAVFGSKGFEHTPLDYLEKNENHTYNNLLSNTGDTKIMIFNPKKWIKQNNNEQRNLNSIARSICGCS